MDLDKSIKNNFLKKTEIDDISRIQDIIQELPIIDRNIKIKKSITNNNFNKRNNENVEFGFFMKYKTVFCKKTKASFPERLKIERFSSNSGIKIQKSYFLTIL